MFKFAIRDDDPNFFTDPEELEAAYSDLPDGVPVSYSVVPFHGCTRTSAIPEEYWNGVEEFPIDENEELVTFLKEGLSDGSCYIMQHGYNHMLYPEGPEFVAGEDLESRVREGRSYLEEVFGTGVDVFVPPNNSFSRRGLESVKGEGMRTLYYPTPLDRPKSLEVLKVTLRDLWFKFRHKSVGPVGFCQDGFRFWIRKDRSIFMPVQPWTYSLQGAEEFTAVSFVEGNSPELIKRQIDIAAQYDAKFCLAVHYHSFRDSEFKKQFYSLIDHAEGLGAEFVTVGELFDSG